MCKYLKRFEAWVGNAASMGGRHTLLDSVVTQLSLYHMSMWLMNKTFIEKLDKRRRRFFWQSLGGRKRYHLVCWDRICRSKDKGGLGVKDLRKQNISLLVKWWWKLDTQEGLWQDIVKAKYLKKDTVATVKSKFNDSPIWKDIMKVKDYYMRGRTVQINSGDIAQVWEDSLNGMPPMRVQYPQLFSICNLPKIAVDKLGGVEAGDMFRRRLNPPLDNMWNEMCTTVLNTISSTKPDQVGWAPGPKHRFTTKSM